MTAFTHTFDFSRVRAAFAPRKPRRPWVRVLLGLVGVALLVALVAVSVVVGVAMISAGLLLRLWKNRNARVERANTAALEGEYRVVRKHALPST